MGVGDPSSCGVICTFNLVSYRVGWGIEPPPRLNREIQNHSLPPTRAPSLPLEEQMQYVAKLLLL